MVRSIDFKSALIGGFVVVMIVFLAGAVDNVPPVRYGRFEIETNESHVFILDTATGEAWSSLSLNPNGGIIAYPDPNFHAPKTLPHSITEP
jgi:hypothetical protein